MAFLDRSSASHCLLANDFNPKLDFCSFTAAAARVRAPSLLQCSFRTSRCCLHAADIAHWVLSHSK